MSHTASTPVRRLWLAVLAGYLALGATLQTLPGFVVGHFHRGTAAAGLAVGIAFAATACSRPFAGRASDSGRARPVVMLGGILTALGGVGHLLAPTFGVLLLSRLAMGAGEAALFSAALPWVLSTASPERRGRAAGWFGLSMWGGLATGPLLAVAAESWNGPVAVWGCVSVLGVLSALLVIATPNTQPETGRSILPSGWHDLVPRGASLPGLGFGLSAYGYGAINALLVLYLSSERIGGATLGLAVFAASFLLARIIGSPQVDRWGGATVAPVVLLAEVVGLGLLAGPRLESTALLGAALTGIGVALMFPATVSMTLKRTGPLTPGTSVGLMTAFWDLGIMVASPLSGGIAGVFGYRAGFGLAALVAFIGILVALALRRPAPAKESRSAERVSATAG